MTSEKALDMLEMIEFKDTVANLHTWYKGIDDDMNEAVRVSIHSLKAWDKVKAEIETEKADIPDSEIAGEIFLAYNRAIDDCLAIIDRHLQEGEK